MIFSPFITRLYGPEAYGLQGLFMAVVNVLASVAGLSYPTAIVLPKNNEEALSIARLSIFVGSATAIVVAVSLIFIGDNLLALFNAQALSAFIFLIPVALIVSVFGATLAQWLIRDHAFSLAARYSVFTSFLLNSCKTGVGLFYPSAFVLIVTNLTGTLLGTVLTYIAWQKHRSDARPRTEGSAPPLRNCIDVARKYSDFPLLRTPQELINVFSHSLPIFMLASTFGAGASGQYSIALTVLAAPVILIGRSVMSVFYPRINEAIHNGENARLFIVRATTGMAIWGALPFLIVMCAGAFMFRIIFGESWETAGVYAQFLAPWIYLQFINKPAVSAIPALRLQGGLLIYEIFSTGTKILALWLGFLIFGDSVVAIALFSLVGSFSYIWLISWVIYRSANQSKLRTNKGV